MMMHGLAKPKFTNSQYLTAVRVWPSVTEMLLVLNCPVYQIN